MVSKNYFGREVAPPTGKMDTERKKNPEFGTAFCNYEGEANVNSNTHIQSLSL